MIEYCTINPINGGPEANDIVLKFYAVYIENPDDYFKSVEPQRAAVYYFPNGLH